MTPINENGNLKQFKLIKLINENSNDDNVVTKISISLRRDKIEAPYYMITKIKMSSCVDNKDCGLIHAMDVLNHNRRYNLVEEKYHEIKSLLNDDYKTDGVEITLKEKEFKIVMITKNNEEYKTLFKKYHEVFEIIDNLVE